MISIRKLRPEDKPQLLVLMKEFWIDYNHGEMIPAEMLEFDEYRELEITMDKEFTKYLDLESYVAVISDKIIGFIVGKVNTFPGKKMDRQGYVEEFFVTKEWRGKGTGRKLFEVLEQRFRELKCKYIALDTNINNGNTLEVYKKMNFIPWAVVLVKKI